MNTDPLMTTEATSFREPAHVVVDDREDLGFPLVSADSTLPDERGGNATNPEQLYAAALAGCFHQSLVLEAGQAGVSFAGSTVTATVDLCPGEREHFDLRARVAVALPEVDDAQRERVLARTMRSCPVVHGVTVELS